MTEVGDNFGEAHAVAVQPDGKLLAGGNVGGTAAAFLLFRYHPDGTLDAGFGTGGRVTTNFGGFFTQINALAVQPDGRIVAAGGNSGGPASGFALARYRSDGTLDRRFGVGGRVLTDFLGNDGARALAAQPDGRVVAAGVTVGDGTQDFALARYLAS